MRQGFVRSIFGEAQSWRWARMLTEIKGCLADPLLPDFTVYVLGKKNYDEMVALGAKCVLVDDKPFLYDKKMFYRNRLHCLVAAARDFDEFVSLDWDCYPTKALPTDFWQQLQTKSAFQAPLTCYKHPRCPWRTVDQRLIPNGGWLYFRDMTIPGQMLKLWEGYNTDLDEIVMAKWTDDQLGGWKGAKAYGEHFEPRFISLPQTAGIYRTPMDKDNCFLHEHYRKATGKENQ